MNCEGSKIVIGSYPYRGNVNVCRMLCEYTGLPYEDMFFNPCNWKKFKKENTHQWLFQELPFLKDGDFVVTDVYPMCEYIINKAERSELLGKTLRDQLVVDQFFSNKDLIQIALSLVVENVNNPTKLCQEINAQWNKTIKNRLLELEQKADCCGLYLGYLTLIDFMIHEILEHYKEIFPKEVHNFPKLAAIKKQVAQMAQIQELQNSTRAVKCICPINFYRNWKLQNMKP